MKKCIELPYSIGDRVWAITGTSSAIEVDIIGYELSEDYKTSLKVVYKTTAVKDGKNYEFIGNEPLYPSKSAVVLHLEEMENLRHNEVLTKLKTM